MDQILKALFVKLPPNSALFFGIAAFIVVVLPPILTLIQTLNDFRFGKKQAEIEKLSWEILKIRYDIEILKKDHQVALHTELEEHAKAQSADPKHRNLGRTRTEALKRAREAKLMPWRWLRWLRDIHALLPTVFLYLCISASGVLTLFFTLMSIYALSGLRKPITDSNRPTADFIAFLLVCTALLAFLAVMFIRQKIKLKASATGPEP